MKSLVAAVKKAFVTPTAQELAQREHAEASRELLAALSHRERADALVHYHTARVRRLQAAIK